jgi:hypothetical protein
MADQARERDLMEVLRKLRAERAGYDRYRRSQRRVRRGGIRARRQVFDESGYPVGTRGPSFTERVARLLNPL